MRRAATIAGLLGSLALAQVAAAHTPYLKPTTFAPDRAFVTAEGALSEGIFFVPDFPIRGEGEFWATGNAGPAVKATSATMLQEFVAVEFALPTEGTYRLSTGERAGRSSKWVKVDGAWRQVRQAGGPGGGGRGGEGGGGRGPGDPPGGGEGGRGGRQIEESAIPAGAETMTSVSYTRAETYVTRGAPSRGSLKPSGKGLELEAITHPNEIFVGEAFKFRLLNDGAPLPGVTFNIARAGDAYSEKRYSFEGKSDPKGAAAVTFSQPGAYVLEAHYPARVEGAPSDPVPRSSTYTLTFEVTR